jgi:hypothetical protein
MAAFQELDWRRLDVLAIAAWRGVATVAEDQRGDCLAWLDQEGYAIESFNGAGGVEQLAADLGRRMHWQQRFGYTLTGRRNLDALRDGFEFEIPAEGGLVFELVRPDIAWRDEPRWLLGLLVIAQEFSLHQLALGRRFFTLLVLPQDSPLIGQRIETTTIPSPFRLTNDK